MSSRGLTLKNLLKEQSALEQQLIELNLPVPEPSCLKFQHTLQAEDQDSLVNPQAIYNQLSKCRKKLAMLISLKADSQAKERSILIIDADLPRTFPHLPAIAGLQFKLQKVLQAFTMYRPDIGYVQGMSYVASMLMLHNKACELQTFVSFCTLITKFPLLCFFQFNDVLIRKVMQLYKQVFAFNLPDLCEHFELENIQPQKYLYEWFMTLFTRVFKDISLIRRIWDLYFLDGVIVLFSTAIAILRLLSEHSEGMWQEFEDILPTLKNAGDRISQKLGPSLEPILIRYISEVSIPKWLAEEIPLLESEFYRQDLKFN